MIVRRFLLWARTAPAEARASGAAALATAYLGSSLSDDERREAETALIALCDDPSPLVRRSVAETLAAEPAAPRAVILSLIAEASDIAALVLARSPILHESDLVDAAAVGDDLAQRAIAQRRHLPVGVTAALAEVAGVEALTVLASNPTVEIPQFSLERMIERFGDCGELREALLARPELPPALRQAIAARVSDALASFVSGCGWLTAERSTRLARESTERVAVALAAGSEPGDADAIVEALRLSGRLTPAIMLRSLLSGEPALAEAAFTALSAMPPKKVAGLLRDRSGSGFRALYRAAGLPQALLPAFAAAAQACLSARRVEGTPRLGLDRRLLQHVLIACDGLEGPEAESLRGLLRRLDTEAAREDARRMADSLADDAALALVLDTAPELLIEAEPRIAA